MANLAHGRYCLITNFNAPRVAKSPYFIIDTINQTATYWRSIASGQRLHSLHFKFANDIGATRDELSHPEQWLARISARCPEWQSTLRIHGYFNSLSPTLAELFPEFAV